MDTTKKSTPNTLWLNPGLTKLGSVQVHKREMDLAVFASKDSTKYVLNSIAWDQASQSWIATDGSYMAILKGKAQDNGPDSFILPSAEVKDWKKATNGEAWTVTKPKELKAETTNSKRDVPVMADIQYPNWRQVVPKPKKSVSIGLSIEKLFEICKYAKAHAAHGVKHLKFTFDVSDLINFEEKPVAIETVTESNGDRKPLTVVLMPMRMS